MTRHVSAVLAAAALLQAPAAAEQPQVLGSVALTWEAIQALPTSGRMRQPLRQPTATLDELEYHVTWLPAGQTSHPPHTHVNEEVVLVQQGTLEAFQNGKRTRIGPGGFLFMASNEPHNVANVGDTTAVYHVINWHTQGMKPRPSASASEGQRVPKAGGTSEPLESKYFDVLRRKRGGGYEFTRRMWSSNLSR